MTIKRNVVVCSVLVVGSCVYGMNYDAYWARCQEKNFTQWTIKILDKSSQDFQEELKTKNLSEEERLAR